MKIEPHLPQLPSIGELLEHPRVKGVVARINRSTVAQRAAGFLEEWRSSLARRAGRIEMPSVTDLAERLARRLLGDPGVEGSVINATGVVVGDPTLAPPLADAAVHAMVRAAGDFHSRESPLRSDIERSLCVLSGAEAALVASSYDAALTLVLAATAAGREALVCGGEDSAASGIDWQWLAARSGAVLRTIASDRETIASTAAAGPRLAAIVRGPISAGALPLSELAPMANQRGVCLIDVALDAGLLNPVQYGFQSVEALRDRVAAGADVVVVDAAGLIGGPACGVIVGKGEYVEAAGRHPLASLVAVDPLTAAGLHATLAAYRGDTQDVRFTLPVWQLLSAPLANLKQRAERLASQMAQSSAIAAADPLEIDSVWRRCGSESFTAKSWAIDIRPKSRDVRALARQLRRAAQPIVAAEADGAVRLDLRSVFPRWDQQLVTSVEQADL